MLYCVSCWCLVGDGVVEWVTCDFAGFGGGCVGFVVAVEGLVFEVDFDVSAAGSFCSF